MGRRPLDMDKIALELALSDDLARKKELAKKILNIAYKKGVYPSSINDFYMARGKGEFPGGFTVPAINLRTMTYGLAKAIFRTAKKIDAGAFIFEIAKSEMGYTGQSPAEYASMCLAAAVKEGYEGPVFIQGDHFQFNAKKYKEDPEKESQGIRDLILHAMEAGFYNIDIDSSTLVDLSQSNVNKEQALNCKACAEIATFIRRNQPRGVMVSVGGEIGEVGKKNSTPEELGAFMKGFHKKLRKGRLGISKISIQTGTSHGGVVLPDGTVAKVKLDFETLRTLSKLAREEFGMAGAVQHGASTLPAEAFGKFPEADAAEVHLATEFQNMVYDSKHFPAELRDRIHAWLKDDQAAEKKEGETEEQFIYKTRKKALGEFKKEILGLPRDKAEAIVKEIESRFEFLFDKLNIRSTKSIVLKHTPLKRVIIRKRSQAGQIEMDGKGDD